MGNEIVLSAGVRQNLLSLQGTASLMATTQTRLATGKRVNSALDNPVNFFTSSGLSSRAKDLTALQDSMANGIKTIEAADDGITAIKSLIETMKSTLLQARQDKSFKSTAYNIALTSPAATDVLSLSGGQVVGTVNVDLTNTQGVRTGAAYANLDFEAVGPVYGQQLNFNIAANGGTARAISVTATSNTNLAITVDGGAATNFTVANANAVTGTELRDALNAAFTAAAVPVPITTAFTGGAIVFTGNTAVTNSLSDVAVTGIASVGATVVTASFGFNAGGTLTKTGVVAQTVDQLVANINANTNLIDKVQASNDGGTLRISNLSTTDLTLVGATPGNVLNGDTGVANTTTIGGNVVRRNLVRQYNDLRDHLNKVADDSSYNGINLLRGDRLKISFNEFGTSSIVIQAKDEFGIPRPINTVTLGIDPLFNTSVDTDLSIDGFLTGLTSATNILSAQASSFGSHLSTVEIRTEFTKQLINTLETGADNLVLADINEESANLLALQTRQQLSTTALSLSAQADQAVLRLFG
jgi:flagellin